MFLVCAVGIVLLAVALPVLTLYVVGATGLVVFACRAWRWRELDPRGRVFVVCGNLAAVVALMLAIAGWSRKPGHDARAVEATSPGSRPDQERDGESGFYPYLSVSSSAARRFVSEAYEQQKQFVVRAIILLPFSGEKLESTRFSPLAETRIAESYNTWRVRGWVETRVSDRGLTVITTTHVEYTLKMEHDPELGLWRMNERPEVLGKSHVETPTASTMQGR